MAVSKGKVMLTFDDGLDTHYDAAIELSNRNLRGVFGIVNNRIGTPGFLKTVHLEDFLAHDHFICNHSHTHPWSGQGPQQPGPKPTSPEDLIKDYLEARDQLNKLGLHGNYLIVPFGTYNVMGGQQLTELRKHFKWIRLSCGAPLMERYGSWTANGGDRLYPGDYDSPIVGLSETADARRPGRVRERVDGAIMQGALAVICYHSVCDVVGRAGNVTWGRFVSDMDYIGDKVFADELECVVPTDLVEKEKEDEAGTDTP